jgi:hypothetical protein
MPTKFYIKKEVGRQMICGDGKHPLPKANKNNIFCLFLIEIVLFYFILFILFTGTVSRDFRLLVFFMNLFPPST